MFFFVVHRWVVDSYSTKFLRFHDSTLYRRSPGAGELLHRFPQIRIEVNQCNIYITIVFYYNVLCEKGFF